MDLFIKDIRYQLASSVLTNAALKTALPMADNEKLSAVTGVMERHVTLDGETALDMGYQACLNLFNEGCDKDDITAILFCTQHPDYVQPANACILHHLLDMNTTVMAFDISVGCSGYLYSLAIARGLLADPQHRNILVVTGNTTSKYVHERDASSRYLIGDASTASIISREKGPIRVQDIQCRTYGRGWDKIIIRVGGCRAPKTPANCPEFTDTAGNIKTDAHFNMDGFAVLGFTTQKVAADIRNYIQQRGLSLQDIDLFIFHQASRKLLDNLAKALRLDAAKIFCNIEKIGNTGASSVAVALTDAWRSGKIQPGDRVILSAFGVGLSWATTMITLENE